LEEVMDNDRGLSAPEDEEEEEEGKEEVGSEVPTRGKVVIFFARILDSISVRYR